MKGPSSHSHADFIPQYYLVCSDSVDDHTIIMVG